MIINNTSVLPDYSWSWQHSDHLVPVLWCISQEHVGNIVQPAQKMTKKINDLVTRAIVSSVNRVTILGMCPFAYVIGFYKQNLKAATGIPVLIEVKTGKERRSNLTPIPPPSF